MFRRRLALGSESKGVHIFSTIVYPTKHREISVYLDILSSFENIFWVSIKELKIFRGFVLRQVFNLTPKMGFECSNALQVASSYLTELHKSSVQPQWLSCLTAGDTLEHYCTYSAKDSWRKKLYTQLQNSCQIIVREKANNNSELLPKQYSFLLISHVCPSSIP